MENPLRELEDGHSLAHAIVNTIHEPFMVLDRHFNVLAASRSFYEIFKVDPEHTHGRRLYDLGDGQWDIPALRVLLETIIPQHKVMDDFEVDHDFPGVGRRIMLLNARMVEGGRADAETMILLAFTDVTERRAVEREKEVLLEESVALVAQKNVLLQEMEHRVANSLQIIASILMLKARGVVSEETRHHLQDAHQRVMSVAAVQSYLYASSEVDRIEVGAYLAKLCASLGASMIGDGETIRLEVVADQGKIGSAEAVNIGLIVTELVINAIKYAFPPGSAGGLVTVSYASHSAGWRLGIADNGVGKADKPASGPSRGLGTVIVKALVKNLDARMDAVSSGQGLSVTITRPDLAALPQAA